jgi:hypothetical protein
MPTLDWLNREQAMRVADAVPLVSAQLDAAIGRS